MNAIEAMFNRVEDAAPLEGLYRAACETPSDISEHLPILRHYSSLCEHVTEFGMRTGNSTIALLAGMPKTFISWDIEPRHVICQRNLDLVRLTLGGRCSFQPRVGDTLKIQPIEPTELLFIDTLHTARQLLAELMRHADPITDNVKRFLIFHDTHTFGWRGEDGTEPGLRAAIHQFQNEAFPIWKVIEDRENNNGLVVLENVRWEMNKEREGNE